MKNKIGYIILGVIVCIFTCSVLTLNNNLYGSSLETMSGGMSKKTIGWGIKRAENNMQPDVGSANKKLLEENEGICLGNDLEKVIYLTFDEGYEAGYTSKILDILKENDVKVTFFITSHYFNTASDFVQRMIDEGHIVGNQF